MPTIADIYRTLQEHEKLEKTAAEKRGIASPQRGSGDPSGEVGAVLEDVLGPNIAETKVRIKKKLEEVAGASKAIEGLTSDSDDEKPTDSQAPIVEGKMPPTGDVGTASTAAKVSAALAKGQEKRADPDPDPGKKGKMPSGGEEKDAAEKMAAEYYAAGQIMAQGFATELNRLLGASE